MLIVPPSLWAGGVGVECDPIEDERPRITRAGSGRGLTAPLGPVLHRPPRPGLALHHLRAVDEG